MHVIEINITESDLQKSLNKCRAGFYQYQYRIHSQNETHSEYSLHRSCLFLYHIQLIRTIDLNKLILVEKENYFADKNTKQHGAIKYSMS